MPKRSEIPHGTNAGYRRGCRKQCCRTAHADTMRDYRSRKAAEVQPEPEATVEVPLEPARGDLPEIDAAWSSYRGPIEAKLREELAGHDAVTPFKATLGEMALFNARILDLTPIHQRFDVASGVQLRMLDIFRRLSETGLEDSVDAGARLIESLNDGGA